MMLLPKTSPERPKVDGLPGLGLLALGLGRPTDEVAGDLVRARADVGRGERVTLEEQAAVAAGVLAAGGGRGEPLSENGPVSRGVPASTALPPLARRYVATRLRPVAMPAMLAVPTANCSLPTDVGLTDVTGG